MHRGIATVSLSGVLTDKLAAAAAAGFDGVEIFDNDLVASPLSPREVARRCADLGLSIDLFQPVRDVQGVPRGEFPEVLHRLRVKLAVMAELGTTTLLACSNVRADASDDPALTAEQLHAVGDLAAEAGVTVAFEALAWGRHVNRLGHAWEAVVAADHPAVTLAVDTFHLLARGDDASTLAGVPGDRIGFLQVADAPLLRMDLLEWSRHHRCFPGQGTLDVTGVVAATLAAGYRGPLSLEVFSDVVREVDPVVTARDAMRSLLFLEDQVAGVLAHTPGSASDGTSGAAAAAAAAAAPGAVRAAASQVTAAPPPARRTDPAFLEVPVPTGDDTVPDLLTGLGFALAGRHRTKPVEWWRHGDASVVLNAAVPAAPAALGLVAPPVAGVAARAKALLWPAVDRSRGTGEAALPGITSPSGLHVFVSADAGDEDHWQRDFEAVAPASSAPDAGEGLLGLDHVGVTVSPEQLNEEVSFFRTVFDLVPGTSEEFMDPHGRLRSRALRPRRGELRVVLNVAERGAGHTSPAGVTQVAFACADVAAQVRALRRRGVGLMRVPDNYYVDLDARFALAPELLDELREHQLLYDRDGRGELLHAYTPPLATGFYVELLERRGGYDGYGSANTHVRLAAQAAR